MMQMKTTRVLHLLCWRERGCGWERPGVGESGWGVRGLLSLFSL